MLDNYPLEAFGKDSKAQVTQESPIRSVREMAGPDGIPIRRSAFYIDSASQGMSVAFPDINMFTGASDEIGDEEALRVDQTLRQFIDVDNLDAMDFNRWGFPVAVFSDDFRKSYLTPPSVRREVHQEPEVGKKVIFLG